MSIDPYPTAPPTVRWSAAMAMLAVELILIVFLVGYAIVAGNHTAQDWLPYALAVVGLHQAPSPVAAVLPPK